MMKFFKRQVGSFIKNHFKINTLIFKRKSIENLKKEIDVNKIENKIFKVNFDVLSKYIISRSDPIEDNEELKTLIKMLLETKISPKKMDEFIQSLKNIISLYPNITIKDYSEIYNIEKEFGESLKNLKSVISDDVFKILNSEKNHNAEFIKSNYKYLYNMKDCPCLNSIIEKNYGELINQIDDLDLANNNNYLLFLIFCRNFLNNEKKKLIFENLKVNEILENKSVVKDYLSLIFENEENCEKRLVEIINIINNNKETRIINISKFYGNIEYLIKDHKSKYLIPIYERTISILDEIDRKKNLNYLLDLYSNISNNYVKLKFLMFMNNDKSKSIFESIHNHLFELYDEIKELTPKILKSYNDEDISCLLKICKNSSSANIMDDKLTWFFENNTNLFINFSLGRRNIFYSNYFILSLIKLSKRNKNNNLLLKKVKL